MQGVKLHGLNGPESEERVNSLSLSKKNLSGAQGDIYSFGIILHEIAARAGTWSLGGGQTLEPRDIVQQIRNRYDLA